jgi:hypothetical protein
VARVLYSGWGSHLLQGYLTLEVGLFDKGMCGKTS